MPDSLSELENGRTVVQAQIAQLGFERNAEHFFVGSRLKQSDAIAWRCCPPQRVHT